MKVLYACCYKADLERDDIVYVDIIPSLVKSKGEYICCDIRNVDFNEYDIIIATPSCNYYSRANYRRETSEYSQRTKDLLPLCINKAYATGKPFLVENVRNSTYMYNLDIPKDVMIIPYGRHTYFTNVIFNINEAEQINENIQNRSGTNRQGGYNVDSVIKVFMKSLQK